MKGTLIGCVLFLGLATALAENAVREYAIFDRRPVSGETIVYLAFLGDYGLTKERYDALDETSRADLDRFLAYLSKRATVTVNVEFQVPASDVFALDFLAARNVSMAVLANNHAGDHGDAGLASNEALLFARGIEPVGTVAHPSRRWTDSGQAFLLFAQTAALDQPCAGVSRVGDKGVDGGWTQSVSSNTVIAVVHDAAPSPFITDYEERVAKQFVSRGARLVVITGSHVTKGAREIGGSLAVFSPGNFLLNWRDSGDALSVAPIVGFSGGKPVYFGIVPFYDEEGKTFRLLDEKAGAEAVHAYQVRSAAGAEAAYRDPSTQRDVKAAFENLFHNDDWKRIRWKHVRLLVGFLVVKYPAGLAAAGFGMCGMAVWMLNRRRRLRAGAIP